MDIQTSQLLWASVFLLAACGADRSPGAIQVSETVSGDTVIVISKGDLLPTAPDSVRIVWQSPRLERPRSMVSVGESLLIGDGTRVHFLRMDGGTVETWGRDGEGPGEFRSITSVGRIGLDTILVFDSRLSRITYLNRNGEYLGMDRIPIQPPFVNETRRGDPLLHVGGSILFARTENVQTARRGQIALKSLDLNSDSSNVIAVWDDLQWTRAGPVMAPGELFGARAIYALGSDGRVAIGNGREYCVSVFHAANPTDVLRVCKDREPVEIGAEIRSPDFSSIDDPEERRILEEMARVQQLPEQMPTFDLIRFAEDGDLWVRTVGEELAHVHPELLWRDPGYGAVVRRWDVFNSGGHLQRTLQLPQGFDPRVILVDRAFGFYELPTGEIVVGEILVRSDLSDEADGR